MKYDIFISYRRASGKNYARILKPELEKRGFKVFLDFDELHDSVFGKRIMNAIDNSAAFLMILTEGALDRCVNENDWVRREILYAKEKNKHIVPVEIDKSFRTFPNNIPNEIKEIIGAHSFAQIDTESLLKESIDKMVKERLSEQMDKKADNKFVQTIVRNIKKIRIKPLLISLLVISVLVLMAIMFEKCDNPSSENLKSFSIKRDKLEIVKDSLLTDYLHRESIRMDSALIESNMREIYNIITELKQDYPLIETDFELENSDNLLIQYIQFLKYTHDVYDDWMHIYNTTWEYKSEEDIIKRRRYFFRMGTYLRKCIEIKFDDLISNTKRIQTSYKCEERNAILRKNDIFDFSSIDSVELITKTNNLIYNKTILECDLIIFYYIRYVYQSVDKILRLQLIREIENNNTFIKKRRNKNYRL